MDDETKPDKIKKSKKDHRVTKTIVSSPAVYKPEPEERYCQAILAENTLYISGLLGLDQHGQLICGGADEQARQVLENMKNVLEASSATLDSVVKTTILLEDINDYRVVNQVYAEYFQKNHPARATYQVGKLPQGAAVEMEAIALSGSVVVAESGPCPCTRT